MGAFESAWALVKMPVVPSSYEDDEFFPSAKFEDPETGETLPIYATQHPQESEKMGFILNQGGLDRLVYNHDWDRLMPSADDIRAFSRLRQNNADGWSPELSITEEPYRRRGYLTAIYDVLARMVADRESEPRLYHLPRDDGGEVLDDGRSFWEGSKKAGKTNPDGSWRVRDDI